MIEYGLPLEIKDFSSDDDEWAVSGYASTFGNRDDGDDIVEKGAFSRTLKERPRVAFLNSHLPHLVLGKPKRLEQDKHGLDFVGHISKTSLGRDTRELIMDEAMGGFSIGFRVAPGGAKLSEDGEIRHLRDLDLFEVSLVAMPMNREAQITGAKSFYWPGMTLAEKAQALAAALDELFSDLRDVSQTGERPLNQTKRQEVEALLETFSGLDDVRSNFAQLLDAASPVGMAAWKEARLQLAEMERLYLKE